MQSVLPPELQRSRWRPTPAQKRQLRKEAERFKQVRRAESSYAAALRRVARHVADIIREFPIGDPNAVAQIEQALNSYAEAISPWARATATRMIAEVSRRDAKAWFTTARQLGQSLHSEINSAPLGYEIQRILEDQVQLITSLPLEAGRRVQQLTQEYVSGGRRYDDLVPLIQSSGTVTRNRAVLIARTETAKAQSAIVQARAKFIGADTYTWRTVQDRDVRPAHRKLNGKVFSWDAPPIAEINGERHHPGEYPNCRCFAEPNIPAIIT